MASRNFVLQYWLSFVWIGMAIFSLFIAITVLLTRTPRGDLNPQVAQFLFIGIGAAVVRFFVDGGRFQREALERNEIDNFALNLVLRAIQIAILSVVWPLLEVFRQVRFLRKAQQAWQRGEVLTTANGRLLHSG